MRINLVSKIVIGTTAASLTLLALGPASYLDSQNMTIASQDRVTVTGSRLNWSGENALIAAEVQKGNTTLVLRDANGIPQWSGWR